jgi:hypothetical protein
VDIEVGERFVLKWDAACWGVSRQNSHMIFVHPSVLFRLLLLPHLVLLIWSWLGCVAGEFVWDFVGIWLCLILDNFFD